MKLLRKNVKLKWTLDCQRSFKILKEKLVTMLVLMLPVEGGHYVVYSDASKQGLGYILMQNGRVVDMHQGH